MKLKRTLRITGLVVLVLFLALTCIFFFWLGPVVKAVAEQVGPKILGTSVTIESLDINPRKGTVHLKGFAIANHEGFGRTNAVSLANLYVSIDPGSLFSDTIVVHRVQLDRPHFVYEQNEATNNISKFIQNVLEATAGKPSDPEDESASERPAKQVLVEALEVTDFRLHVANTHNPALDIELGMERLGLSMTNGIVELESLSVSNPDMLNRPKLFTLDRIDVELDPDALLTDQPVIDSIRILRPHVHLEQNPKANTTAEFIKLADSIMQHLPESSAPAESADAGKKPDRTPQTLPPVLKHLLIDDIQVTLLNTAGTNTTATARMLAGIDEISAELDEGTLHIGEITVPNTPGFADTNLFHLAGIDIALNPDTLFADQLIIESVSIGPASIHLEQTETSGNVSELSATLNHFVPKAPPASPNSAPPATETEKPEPIPLAKQPVILESLQATNFTVYLRMPLTTNLMAGTMSKLNLDKLNPLENVSIKDLNPMKLLGGGDTNATEAVITESGPLKLLTFDLLLVEPMKGNVELLQLKVANLSTFSNPHLATIDAFRLSFDPATATAETIVIREIVIESPLFTYELQVRTDNIRAMTAAIALAMERKDAMTKQPEAPEPEPDTPAPAGQKVIIERLAVNGGQVKPKLSILPSVPIPLPAIEQIDIGKNEGGASMTEAFTLVGTTLYDAILGSVAGATGMAGDVLKGAGSMTFGKLLDMTREPDAEEINAATDEPETTDKNGKTKPDPKMEEKSEEPERSRSRRRGPRIRHFP